MMSRRTLLVLAPSTGDRDRDQAALEHAVLRLNLADFDTVTLEDLHDVLTERNIHPLGHAGFIFHLVRLARETDGLVVLPGAEDEETAAALLAALEGMERRTVPGWLTWIEQQRYMCRLRHPAGKGRVNA